MKISSIFAILLVLSVVVFTVSALNPQDSFINSLGKYNDKDNKINLQKLANSDSMELKQIPQYTKQIAIDEVIQKSEEMKEVPIIVWVKSGEDSESIAQSTDGFELKYIYDQLNGFSGTATKEAINQLKADKRIDYLAFDAPIKMNLIQSRPIVQANVVESNYSLTGQGIGVCHLDTGINYNHPNLAAAYAGGYDFVNNDSDPMDDNMHGTYTAGIIASDHSSRRGMSPGVDLLALKVLDANGLGVFSDVAAGINWCVANKNTYNIGVISMSLGTNGFVYAPSTSPGYVEPALLSAYYQNIVSVASTGNDGSLTGITYPAVSPYVISVAASYDADLGPMTHPTGLNSTCTDSITNPNIITCFSNRASFIDVVAPGSAISSTSLGGGFGAASGTSAAAPHVTGTIALMKQRNFQMRVEQVRNNLNKTGIPIYDNATGLTFSRVNALNAVRAVPYITITGTLGPGNTMYMNMSDPLNAGLIYITALSWGNSPGIPLPNGLTLPLNYDVLLQVSSGGNTAYVNNVGILDSNGRATATFYVPNITGIENWTIYSGFTNLDFNLPELFVSVSNAAQL